MPIHSVIIFQQKNKQLDVGRSCLANSAAQPRAVTLPQRDSLNASSPSKRSLLAYRTGKQASGQTIKEMLQFSFIAFWFCASWMRSSWPCGMDHRDPFESTLTGLLTSVSPTLWRAAADRFRKGMAAKFRAGLRTALGNPYMKAQTKWSVTFDFECVFLNKNGIFKYVRSIA